MIDGNNDRSHWRFTEGGPEIWRCPKCHGRGDGDKTATIEIRPHRYIGRGGKKLRSPLAEVCVHCLSQGIITEV